MMVPMIVRSGLFVLMLSLVLGRPGQAQPRPADGEALQDIARLSQGYRSLARQVNAAVVQVHAHRYRRQAQRSQQQAGSASIGSGVIVDSTGYIVTNAHVVAGAYDVDVRLARAPQGPPGKTSIVRPRGDLLDATLLGIDRETDLAVLRVEGSGFPHLPFGDSDRLRPGEVVFAFGSPRSLENSVSMGIVSATGRQIRDEDPMVYVQTDAPINPGSSGGPLVNTEGEVVGINTFILSPSGGSDGLGFAAPSNIVETIYRQIRARGHVRRGIIGVHAQTLTPELAEALGLRGPYRVVLGDVYPGGPAAQAGLQPGDVIVRLNGKFMENARQFDVNLYGALGQVVELELWRQGRTLTASVQVVERQDPLTRFTKAASPEEHRVDRLGVLVLPLTPEMARLIPRLRHPDGLLIAASDGPMASWGERLEPGDVLYGLDGQRITSLEQLRAVVDGLPPEATVSAHVQRQGRLMYLALGLP
jgi:serine protease Do